MVAIVSIWYSNNILQQVGGSVTGVMADLEDIWLNALEVEMNIQKQDLSRFKVIKYSVSQFFSNYFFEILI